jgi:hypothetical protein
MLGLMKAVAGRDIWLTYFIILPGLYFLPLNRNRSFEGYNPNKKFLS